MSVDTAYQILYSLALLVLGVLIALMLVRSVIGPRITDRLLSINMIGTMVIACLAILSQMLHEGFLTDVALIYAMISYISVLILSRTYIPADPRRARMGEEAFKEVRRTRRKSGRRRRKRPDRADRAGKEGQMPEREAAGGTGNGLPEGGTQQE